jgi:hypothetical protein
VKRRTFLAAAGAVGIGALGYGRGSGGPLVVRIWFSERAASYDGLQPRVEEYVGRALADAVGPVEVTFGESVAVSSEDAYRLVTSAEWPRLLLERLLQGDGPVRGVNLLVTDGDMRTAPTGAGFRHLAAVGGAQTLADLPPADRIPSIVDRSEQMRIAQVLLHEIGHALGLSHDHGAIEVTDDGPVVTPMVSSYAWAPEAVRRSQFDYESNACGAPYPIVTPENARLSLRYSECARRELSR